MTNALTGALPARRGSRVPKSWQSKFIATLSETSNVAAAARAAKVSTSWVYQSRRESPEFAQLWFAALCDGYDALEMDLLYRLRTGKVEETDENGTKRKFDSATAFKCLLAHRETVSREKARQGTDDESAILASINAKIEAMRQRDRDRTLRPSHSPADSDAPGGTSLATPADESSASAPQTADAPP